MKKTYKNRAMRSTPDHIDPPKPGKPEDRIKIYLGEPHRELAQRIADKMGLSLEQLISAYICQMVADGRWPS